MMMDWATLGIFSVSFVFCGLLVFVVSVFGAQETSFEEALREQKAKLAREKRDKAAKRQGEGQTTKKADKKKAALSTGSGPSDSPRAETRGAETRGALKKKIHPPQAESHDQVTPRSEHGASPLVEEATPRATPEPPTGYRAGKAKSGSRKIPIEEVADEPPIVAAEPAPVVHPTPVVAAAPPPSPAPVQPAPVPGKKEKASVQTSRAPPIGKLQPRELISVVKKTALDDGEVQQLIDILLNKQAGSSAGSPATEWIEPTAKGAQNETKNLQRQLVEKETALEDERVKVKSITERMHVLRQELNQVKSELVGSQRAHEETKARAHQELNTVSHRLKADQEGLQRDLAQYQTQLTYQMGQNQTLQGVCDQLAAEKQQWLAQVQTAPVVDPQIYAELEQLRLAKISQDSHIADLTSQMAERQVEVDRLAQKLGEAEHKHAQAEQQVSQAQQEVQSFQTKEKASSKSIVEKAKEIEELRSQVGELTGQVKKSQVDLGRLEEEKERLAAELTEKVERPRADGEESQGTSSNGVNGHHGSIEEHQIQQQQLQQHMTSAVVAQEESSAWQLKYQNAVEQKEILVKENEAALSKLHAEISAYKKQLQDIQSELETQKAKNDELRTKNWKVMEALSATESLYQKLLKSKQDQQQQPPPISSSITSSSSSQTSTTKTTSSSSQADFSGAMQKAKSDSENAHKALLLRLFPGVDVASSGHQSHEQWLEAFSTEVKRHFEAAQGASNGKDHEDESAETVEQLQKKISNYKSILAHTETMLTSLQDSVESEEQTWKTRLSDKESELSTLLVERDSLLEKNTALEESLKVLKQAEEIEPESGEPQSFGVHFALSTMERALPQVFDEMQEILHELQQKLAKEEQEKLRLIEERSMTEKHSVEAAKMKEELDSMRSKLVEEEKKNVDLGLQVAKLNQLVPQNQEEASSPEKKKTIELSHVKMVDEDLKSPSLVSSILQDFSSPSRETHDSSDSESQMGRDSLDSPTTPVANGATKLENEAIVAP
ncbi:ribosome-binding protein 1-like isoform X2 [Tigriopus californicus]|uniref:ribosome-binding protein 1-like isoform X2 n=1 Tax=Tigriopus californicus TaxID=6832 RepID=UPI0027DA90E2|nr:ribosome-binding protein 1-like isoform X2 [Tigriopus californicus]